ncbi:MAG: glycoside hydrolase family 43 protein, partial [Bacteroidaceae bacterium]|nr:glycoside hydrolase family 43 protein [Bacteroidaceae bacterium]
KDETHQLFMAVSQTESGRSISLIKVDGEEDKVINSKPLPADATCFDLKVFSDGYTYEFVYSLDKGKHWDILATAINAAHLSTATAGGFTGSTIALYATSK